MSSTSRGGQRNADDFYETPRWAIDAILRELGPAPSRVLEPTAGAGAIVRALRSHWPTAMISAVELDIDRAKKLLGAGADRYFAADFLEWSIDEHHDLAITNPPFSLALPVIEKSLTLAREVVMLLRLNFLGSAERVPFWKAHPADIFVLPRRPSYAASLKCTSKACDWAVTQPLEAVRPKRCLLCGAKRTVSTSDSCEYAWFAWGPGRGGRWKVLDIEEEAPSP